MYDNFLNARKAFSKMVDEPDVLSENDISERIQKRRILSSSDDDGTNISNVPRQRRLPTPPAVPKKSCSESICMISDSSDVMVKSRHDIINKKEVSKPSTSRNLGSPSPIRSSQIHDREHWASSGAGKIIGDKVINLNFKECYTFRTSSGQVVKTLNHDLTCEYHEEADTKIVYHACKSKKKIVIKCSDSDILIILLAESPDESPEISDSETEDLSGEDEDSNDDEDDEDDE
ncbi:unnamed protein product [Phaedon cochleariae]|uniref:Uncharacterized protein n=1 Tax=Phaedon cochleariae TaxID=80249 RepID=A0A9N9SJQ0_PHACE|nr:unnamed protein product [Phaedon cochleariae]